MRRLLLVLLVLPVISWADDGVSKIPGLAPKPGERAIVYMKFYIEGFPLEQIASRDVETFKEVCRLELKYPADVDGIRKIVKSGKAVTLPSRMPVIVKKIQTFDVGDAKPCGALVEIEDGVYKGEQYWLSIGAIMRALHAVPSSDAPRRAASLLKSGQNLEKAGKTAGSLGFYRQVVNEFPGTAEAKTATERIKALGGKVPPKKDTKAKPDSSPSTGTIPRPASWCCLQR